MELSELESCGLGYGLSVEERACLDTHMHARRMHEKLHSIKFWGRISGTTSDYLIVCALISVMEAPSKKFYFATSKKLVLQEMPALTQEFAAAAAGITSRFVGNPSKLLGADAEAVAEEEEEEEATEEGEEPKPRKPRFSEAHRLAYVVSQIENDTAVVPRGAYAVTPTHHIVPNSSFSGLSATVAGDLNQYHHFRPSTHPVRKHALTKAAVIGSGEFLDPVAEDTPKGVWTIRTDEGRGEVSIRSLKWPGYFFVHRIESPSYWGVYFGDGRVNADLPFMM